jgi:hypothetical protein
MPGRRYTSLLMHGMQTGWTWDMGSLREPWQTRRIHSSDSSPGFSRCALLWTGSRRWPHTTRLTEPPGTMCHLTGGCSCVFWGL